MEQFGGMVVKHQVSQQISQVKNKMRSVGQKQSEINWSDYNFPPCLNLIHYNLEEVDEAD